MQEKLPVSVMVGGKKYELDYQKQLESSEELINENLKEQPGLFAWYAVLSELATADVDEAKLRLEMVEASLDQKFRASIEKLTETKILAMIKLDNIYIQARSEFLVARKNANVLGAIRDAFSHRLSTLISLASNMRVQADPEIFIKKKEIKETP